MQKQAMLQKTILMVLLLESSVDKPFRRVISTIQLNVLSHKI